MASVPAMQLPESRSRGPKCVRCVCSVAQNPRNYPEISGLAESDTKADDDDRLVSQATPRAALRKVGPPALPRVATTLVRTATSGVAGRAHVLPFAAVVAVVLAQSEQTRGPSPTIRPATSPAWSPGAGSKDRERHLAAGGGWRDAANASRMMKQKQRTMKAFEDHLLSTLGRPYRDPRVLYLLPDALPCRSAPPVAVLPLLNTMRHLSGIASCLFTLHVGRRRVAPHTEPLSPRVRSQAWRVRVGFTKGSG